MYVCLCQGITDKQIAASVERGAQSLNAVRAELNIASQCGQCTELATKIIENSLSHIEATTPYYQVA